jgi:hypothetical protein
MIKIIENPEDFITDQSTWWMIFNPDSNVILMEPNVSSGKTTSHFIMITADSKQELEEYISARGLIYL